jgi:uncharacterized protein (DUF169 family)
MSSFALVAETLRNSLQLSQPPIAICFADSVPAGVATFSRSVPAGCRFWQEAAKGVFATEAKQHDLCSIGLYTHNLEMTPRVETDLGDALRVFGDLGYVRPQDIPLIPVLKQKARVIVYGPLADVPLAPDVVLLFATADQSLILSEASQQLEGGLPPAMGRPACAIVPQAFNTGRTALSLGCCGARAYLDVLRADVALYAIPGVKIEEFAERVAALANANGVLTQFHMLRRAAVEGGQHPSVRESLAAMG